MSALLLGFVAALLAGVGSREQLLAAAEAVRGRSGGAIWPGMLGATLVTAGAAVTLAAAGAALDARTRLVIAGLGLLLAGCALGAGSRRAIADPAALPLPPAVAFTATLLALQANGPLPLAVAAAALVAGAAQLTLAGAVLGALVPLGVAAMLGETLAGLHMARWRVGAAGLLAAAGGLALLAALGIV